MPLRSTRLRRATRPGLRPGWVAVAPDKTGYMARPVRGTRRHLCGARPPAANKPFDDHLQTSYMTRGVASRLIGDRVHWNAGRAESYLDRRDSRDVI